jgi:EAL domain-containing protein (putative c-di-GMP-specific phosphodiesterase class I)/CheY-like chemotaxis protein
MEQPRPLRVLLVTHSRTDRGLAKHVLSSYDLDFDWACAASPHELLKIASDFAPDVVLCGQCARGAEGHGLLDTLRLLCSQPPVILVSRLRSGQPTGGERVTDAFLDDLREPGAEAINAEDCAPAAGAASDTQGPSPEEVIHLRRAFACALESSGNPAVMCDTDGWVTFVNRSACRALAEQSGCLVGTLLDESADFGAQAPHWMDVAREANRGNDQYSGPLAISNRRVSVTRRVRRLAYFDARSGRPQPIHIDTLVGHLRTRSSERRSALALVASDLRSERISGEASFYSLAGEESNGVAGEEHQERPIYGSVVRITPEDYLLALPELCSVVEAAFTAQQVLESIGAEPPTAPHPARRAACGRVLQSPPAPAQSEKSVQERLERDLADALKRHALSVQYQPQYEVESGRGCGMEALVRWTLASGEIVSPSKFIPVAERSGMIHELGAWVLESACESVAAWSRRVERLATLSVNVSVLQIDERFCRELARVLKHSGFPAKQLELEITESALIKNTERTIECLREWKQLGVRIAVDDFGTGYSSLSYLSRLPIDCLKLDQSLIQSMTLDSKGAAVTRSIVSLGAELGIDVIAEGVETEQQFQMLATLGCPRVQGYLLGRPMSATQAQVVLRKTWGNRPTPPHSGRPPINISYEARQVH